jgi:hypothetical protein
MKKYKFVRSNNNPNVINNIQSSTDDNIATLNITLKELNGRLVGQIETVLSKKVNNGNINLYVPNKDLLTDDARKRLRKGNILQVPFD